MQNLLVEIATDPNRQYWPWIAQPEVYPPTMSGGRPWPKITIVTPSYNQGDYLEETIRSVLLQGYPNLEYIVMDGGSTDSSVEIIKKYAPWLTYWESVPDRGQSHAINKGFEKATGDIMGWINSDDGLLPNALRTIAETLEHERQIMVGACLIGDSYHDQQATIGHKKPQWKHMLYGGNTFWQPGVFWTKKLWQDAGPLREDIHYVMDYDLWLRMIPLATHVNFINKTVALARIQPEQKTRPENEAIILQEREICALCSAIRQGESALSWFVKTWLLHSKRNFVKSRSMLSLLPLKSQVRALSRSWKGLN